MEKKPFVCPVPTVWNSIYRRLLAESERKRLPRPPKPLILAAWWTTSNLEKKIRWQETVQWAAENRIPDLIPTLQDEHCHFVND